MIFKIRHLTCRYPGGPPVLKVPKLDIPGGEMIFLIGASGIGKSTFLEALGLMNQTIFNDDSSANELDVQFMPVSGTPVQLAGIWQKSDSDTLSELRNKYFSFIFQQTNLFPHFSVGENMMLSKLLSGSTISEAREEVIRVMKRLDLDTALFDRRIVEISGGQRQRLAFVRAFTASFDVLFADEPTGNLDPVTSRKLLQILHDYLKETGKTGILVSHDINLALEFADQIIPIIKKESDNHIYGIIDETAILRKVNGQWPGKDPGQQLWSYISD